MTEPNLTGDGLTVTVRVPISIRNRGGRKLVLAPDGTTDTWAAPSRRIDNAMLKAIARAFRWREMLENGTHATIADRRRRDESSVGRVLRLTCRSRKPEKNLGGAIENQKDILPGEFS